MRNPVKKEQSCLKLTIPTISSLLRLKVAVFFGGGGGGPLSWLVFWCLECDTWPKYYHYSTKTAILFREKRQKKPLSWMSASGSKVGCLTYLLRNWKLNSQLRLWVNIIALYTLQSLSYDFTYYSWRMIRNIWYITRSGYQPVSRGRQGASGVYPTSSASIHTAHWLRMAVTNFQIP